MSRTNSRDLNGPRGILVAIVNSAVHDAFSPYPEHRRDALDYFLSDRFTHHAESVGIVDPDASKVLQNVARNAPPKARRRAIEELSGMAEAITSAAESAGKLPPGERERLNAILKTLTALEKVGK